MRLAELPYSSMSYSRALDEVSNATVEIPTADAIRTDCCLALDTLTPWEHELVVYRDDTQVWVGPVVDVTYTRDTVTIAARDMFAWMERRKIEMDLFPFEKDLSRIFEMYVEFALARENSMGITVNATDSRVTGTRENIGATSRQAGDELRELARTGVDFTTVGRIIYVAGDLSDVVAPGGFGYFTDDAFSDVTVTKNGMDAATEVTIYGDAGDNPDDPVRGVAGGVHPTLGLVQITDDDTEILDFESAETAARTRLDTLADVPLTISAVLSPTAPIDFNDLWAGVRIPVAVTVGCTEYFGEVRVADVAVSSDENTDETVTVSLVPVGALQVGS